MIAVSTPATAEAQVGLIELVGHVGEHRHGDREYHQPSQHRIAQPPRHHQQLGEGRVRLAIAARGLHEADGDDERDRSGDSGEHVGPAQIEARHGAAGQRRDRQCAEAVGLGVRLARGDLVAAAETLQRLVEQRGIGARLHGHAEGIEELRDQKRHE
jgi:hypothetical protein